jgi:hypothetical protein
LLPYFQFVAEFAPKVAGLHAYHPPSQGWIDLDPYLVPGREIVLFGGECLEGITGIPALLHRVGECPGVSRSIFLFEQKYASLARLANVEGRRVQREESR